MTPGEQFILALDQGTTSSRAILFDHAGNPRAVAQREFAQHFPQPGWVEHDAEEIWQSQLDVARSVLQQANIEAHAVAAIGIANQRETTVLWERATGRPLYRAIVWQDRRTAPLCEALRAAGHEAEFSARSGLLLDPYFSGTKLAWLLDNIPDARGRARRGELAFGTIDSWLVWNLSGGRLHITDASNASRTLLYNIHANDWDDELLALLDIPPELLPRVVASSTVYGECDAHWLGAAIPIAGIAGDQQAATFGQACLAPGMTKNTYGTGCFMLMNTGQQAIPSAHRLLTTVLWKLGTETSYALEGSVFMGGAIIQWLRDGLGIIQAAGEVEALAMSVADSGGVTLIPAFAGLGAPWWKPDARAALTGMTRGTTRAHIARAALDAIALQSADLLAAMENDSGVRLAELRVDGGAAHNNLLLQIQADLLGVTVVRPRVTETTALGAAYLAGLAVGFWQSPEDVASHWQIDRRFEPSISDTERRARLTRWQQEIKRAIA
ncbi:glycerol kinase [Georgfuchsia toluolica]|uniref:Glycerol kinase n=1 Tax=Georgfuchsia toluolica TaxID=424218 RepID=A0A916J4H3_9PROT|nr:glycerol kinase GlpK [Georgfuchsia toluolica]CAG4883833.1 glycerol kinase [Georgfuchsia toluolica]